MEDVVIPQLSSSFDVEAEKPLDVKTQELEQKAIERDLISEIENANFPVIRQHFEELITSYGDVRTLVELSDKDFISEARAKAVIVKELKDLLAVIDQIGGVDGEDERE
jgi:pyruvate carboxylase